MIQKEPKKLEVELRQALEARQSDGSLRSLKDYSQYADFSSNDYLGLARSKKSGSTGSRLISGNHSEIEDLEGELRSWIGFDAALVFNSGYVANLGLFQTVPKKQDVVLYDEYIHASIRDGLRLGVCKSYGFRHNDLTHLRERLNKFSGQRVFVVVESVYSMDGDSPDFIDLIQLKEEFGFYLIVDEAHSIGVVGEKGAGIVNQLGIQDHVFAQVVTFGKGVGLHGAAILGSRLLKDYLVNFCRSFIYTTGIARSSSIEILDNIREIKGNELRVRQSQFLKSIFISELKEEYDLIYGPYGNVVSVVVSGVIKVKELESRMLQNGIFAKAILKPTVPEGQERLRICFHEFNTEEEVRKLITVIKG